MNNSINKLHGIRKRNYSGVSRLVAVLIIFTGIFLNSCQDDEEIIISAGEPISLSLSNPVPVLSQKQAFEPVFSFKWTRGTNHGTSSSISYTLLIDRKGNNFANAKSFDLGTGVYEKTFTAGYLNDLLLNYWNINAGVQAEFEAKVLADVLKEGVEDGVSEILTFSLTPYEPVTEQLFLVGSATPNGWDIGNATPMIQGASQPWIFTYEGPMKTGSFKFAVNTDGCWCQDFYTRDPDNASKMVFNRNGSGDDYQWEITEGGNYLITVDLVDLLITIKRLAGPAFTNLYIVGDASPSGWNIGDPQPFTQSASDPFIFTYEAVLTPGEFKISTFKGNWCDGQWLNASQPDQDLTAADFVITNGCDGPDNKWRVTEETQGRYNIRVDLYNNSIKIEKVLLYLIGDGGPNGWNIGSPAPMDLVDGIYTFVGELGANNPTGEFKFSKYKGDWCDGDWIIAVTPDQSVTDTRYTIRHGCEGADNKWRLKTGEAGTYKITIDLVNEIMTINKQ